MTWPFEDRIRRKKNETANERCAHIARPLVDTFVSKVRRRWPKAIIRARRIIKAIEPGQGEPLLLASDVTREWSIGNCPSLKNDISAAETFEIWSDLSRWCLSANGECLFLLSVIFYLHNAKKLKSMNTCTREKRNFTGHRRTARIKTYLTKFAEGPCGRTDVPTFSIELFVSRRDDACDSVSIVHCGLMYTLMPNEKRLACFNFSSSSL